MSSRLENNQVAARYAKALFESVSETKELKSVFADLQIVRQLFEQLPELMRFFENPGVPFQEKDQLLQSQFQKQVNTWVYRMLILLLENKRMVIFPQLVEQFISLHNQQENTVSAEVITAVELDEPLKKKMTTKLEKVLGFRTITLQNRVDPGLLGGVVVKIQDQIIDGSYIGRLEALRKQIAAV